VGCDHGWPARVHLCRTCPEDILCSTKLLTFEEQGGKFHIQITLPKEYPFKPPTLSFRTKVYHPNVTNDERGAMCLGMLRADEWKPPNKIEDVLKLVRVILETPQPDDAVELGIAEEFKNSEYHPTIASRVDSYANKRIRQESL